MFKKKTPSLIDARRAFQNIKDYWDDRIRIGDPLFDQWMVDSLNSAKEGLALLDRMQDNGHETGKNTVTSSLKPFKKIKVFIRAGFASDDPRYQYSVFIDKTVRVSSALMVPSSVRVEDYFEARIREDYRDDIDKKTKVSVKVVPIHTYYRL